MQSLKVSAIRRISGLVRNSTAGWFGFADLTAPKTSTGIFLPRILVSPYDALKIRIMKKIPNMFLGDNGGRSSMLPYPTQFNLAEANEMKILPGSDPLPFPQEAKLQESQQHRRSKH